MTRAQAVKEVFLLPPQILRISMYVRIESLQRKETKTLNESLTHQIAEEEILMKIVMT